MTQLELFENMAPENSQDVSTWAKVFLDLYTGSFYSETFRESQRENLFRYVENCSDYHRGLYCEWVRYYAREWEIDIGQPNLDLLERCIFNGGRYEYLI